MVKRWYPTVQAFLLFPDPYIRSDVLKTVIAAATVLGGLALAGTASAAPAPFPVLHTQGSEQVASNHDVFTAPGNAGLNSPVLGEQENFNGGSEFTEFFYNTNPHGNAVVGWRLTPGGVDTNLCVADPGPGYGASDAIVLRTCNGLIWQRFRVLPQANTFTALQNVASNQYITDNGTGNGLLGIADNRPCVVGLPCSPSVGVTNTFPPVSSTETLAQEWKWTGGLNVHLARSLSFSGLGSVNPSPAPADFTAPGSQALTITHGLVHGVGTVTASAVSSHLPVHYSISTSPSVSYVSIGLTSGRVMVHRNPNPGNILVTVTATDSALQSESVTFTLHIS